MNYGTEQPPEDWGDGMPDEVGADPERYHALPDGVQNTPWLGLLTFVVSLLLHGGLMLLPVASESTVQKLEEKKPQDQVKVVKAKTLAPPIPKPKVQVPPKTKTPPKPKPKPKAAVTPKPRPKPRPRPAVQARVSPPVQLPKDRSKELEAKRRLEEAQRREEAKRKAEEEAKRQAIEADQQKLKDAEAAEALKKKEEEAKRKAEEEAKRQAEEDAKRQAEEERRLQEERLAQLNAARDQLLAATSGGADLADTSRQLALPPDPSWFSDPALFFTQESIQAVLADPTERLVNKDHVMAATIYERTPAESVAAYQGDAGWQGFSEVGRYGGGTLYRGNYQQLELFINIIKRQVEGGVPSTVEVLMSQDPNQL